MFFFISYVSIFIIAYLSFQLDHDWVAIFAYPESLSIKLVDCLAIGVEQSSKMPSSKNPYVNNSLKRGNSTIHDYLERISELLCKTFNCSVNILENHNIPTSYYISFLLSQDVYFPIGSNVISLFHQSDVWLDLNSLLKSKVIYSLK